MCNSAESNQKNKERPSKNFKGFSPSPSQAYSQADVKVAGPTSEAQ